MSLQAAWKGWQAIQGDRSMPMLKKAFGVYEHTEDPAFERDMQAFQQNPTRGNADRIINKWGDYLEADNYKELGQRLNYLEGTPQDIQHQINKNQLTQSNIRTEALPELTDAELRIKQGQADITQSNANYQSRFNEQKYNYNDIRNDLQRLDLAFQEQTQPSSIEAEIAKANAQAAQGNYQSDYYGNLDPNQMAEYKMTQAGEQANQAEIQTDITNEQLTRIQKENSVLNEQLQNDLTIQEQNILSNKINNKIRELELEKGRKLLPYELDQAKNSVLKQELQIEGLEYQNEVAADESYLSGRKTDLYRDMTDEQLSAALFGTGGSQDSGGAGNSERIVGQTSDGRNIYNSVGGGYYTYDPRTGQSRALTKREYQNANITTNYGKIMMNPAESLIENPIIGNTLSSEQVETIRANYDRQMPIEKAQKVINSYVNDPDLTNLIMTSAMGGPENIDKRKNINYHSYNQEPEERQTQSYSNMSTKQLINLFEEKNPNMSPQELAEYLKIYRESIEQNLGVDIGSVIGQLSMTGEDIGF